MSGNTRDVGDRLSGQMLKFIDGDPVEMSIESP
jgi:hypothetical protein